MMKWIFGGWMITILAAQQAAPPAPTSWLQDNERAFFKAFGASVRVDDKESAVRADVPALADLAKSAAEPWKSRLARTADAFQHRDATPEERRRFSQCMSAGIAEARLKLGLGLLAAFTSDDPWQVAPEIVRDTLIPTPSCTEAFRILNQCTERFVRCNEEIQSEVRSAVMDLEARIGSPRADATFVSNLRLVIDGGRLGVSGKVGASAMDESVLLAVVHRKRAEPLGVEFPDWSELIQRNLGIKILGISTGRDKSRTTALDGFADAGFSSIHLLPKMGVASAFLVRLDAPLASLNSIDSVDVRLLTAGGSIEAQGVENASNIRRVAHGLLELRDRIDRRDWNRALLLFKDFVKANVNAPEVSSRDVNMLKADLEKGRAEYVQALVLLESQFRKSARTLIKEYVHTHPSMQAARAWASGELATKLPEHVRQELQLNSAFQEHCSRGVPGWLLLERGEAWLNAVNGELVSNLRKRHAELPEFEKLSCEWTSFGNGSFTDARWWTESATSDFQREDYILAVLVDSKRAGFEIKLEDNTQNCLNCQGTGKQRYLTPQNVQAVKICDRCNGARHIRRLSFR